MSLWPVVTKDSPCPICGYPDWCAVGDKAIKCMRVSSDHACESGGWYHFVGESVRLRPVPARPRPQAGLSNVLTMLSEWNSRTTQGQYVQLASTLGVSLDAVHSLQAVYAKKYGAWAFPMRDGNGKIVGIRLRNLEGQKWAVTGSRQGLFIPQQHTPMPSDTLWICEGPTDTMAALTIGAYAIGRPSAQGCIDEVLEYLPNLAYKRIVIIYDTDIGQSDDGGVGMTGAKQLRRKLGKNCQLWSPHPSFKDLREAVRFGWTKKFIELQMASFLYQP